MTFFYFPTAGDGAVGRNSGASFQGDGKDIVGDGGDIAEEVVERVEGVVGEKVALPCHISPPEGDRVAVILWYKQHHPDALYT